MSERFAIEEAVRDTRTGRVAYVVIDNQYQEYNLPKQAVQLRMSAAGATRVAMTMNSEWADFLANPW